MNNIQAISRCLDCSKPLSDLSGLGWGTPGPLQHLCSSGFISNYHYRLGDVIAFLVEPHLIAPKEFQIDKPIKE